MPDIITILDIIIRKGVEPGLAAEIAEEICEDWEFLSQQEMPDSKGGNSN